MGRHLEHVEIQPEAGECCLLSGSSVLRQQLLYMDVLGSRCLKKEPQFLHLLKI